MICVGRLDEAADRQLGHVQPAGRPLDRVEVAVRVVAEEVAGAERAVVRTVDVELVGVTRLVADPSRVVEAGHRDDVVATDDDDVGERRVRRDARRARRCGCRRRAG